MRKVIRKLFWAWDFDKEEKWLNEMASKGLALCAVGFCRYEFEQCKPGEYAVCLQMLENKPQHAESEKYIEFVEETGAEHVGSYLTWVYFRKKTEDGPFELHGDYQTRIRHLRSIMALLVPLLIINCGIGMHNLWIGIHFSSALNQVCACLNIGVSVLLGIGLKKLNDKKRQMEKDAQLFE